jgi:excisionase family DNA binding protein
MRDGQTVESPGQVREGGLPLPPLEARDTVPAVMLPACVAALAALQARVAARLAAATPPSPPHCAAPPTSEAHPMTQEEVAERYRLPLRTVRRLTRTGRVPSYTQGRNRMVRPTDLDHYLARCRTQGVKVGTILDV